jgi:hypothetical protein
MTVSEQELLILAAWQFPGRLEAVIIAVLDYQTKRNIVTDLTSSVERSGVLVSRTKALRDRLHPEQQDLVNVVAKEHKEKLRGLGIARSGLVTANDRLMDAAGASNAHALLDFFDAHHWQATRDQLTDFLLERVDDVGL